MTQPLNSDDTSPAEAFEAMSRRLAGLIATVDGFAARQQDLLGRDYSEDLARIDDRCTKLRQALLVINARPAMSLTPENIAEQIESAGSTVREADHRAWVAAHRELSAAIGAMAAHVTSAREANRQRQWLAATGCGALLLGSLLGSSVPLAIDRAAPEAWYWPERRAAAVLERDGWDAGTRLMQVSEPERWQVLHAASRFWRDNAQTLTDCRKSAARKGKAINCVVRVGA